MPTYFIDDLADGRLDPYRNIRTTNLTRFSGRFIAESEPLVRRLVASPLSIESIVVDSDYLDEAKRWIPDAVQLLAIAPNKVSELIGFNFHRGYLACGFRPQPTEFQPLLFAEHSRTRSLPQIAVLLVGVQDPENMGSIMRSCAALGIDHLIIGPNCVDPFARRVLRVSMGNAFKLNLSETTNPTDFLKYCAENNFDSVAACLNEKSQSLENVRLERPCIVLFGNEAHGLPQPLIDLVSKSVKIDMELGTDSLNVSVAAGIFLHYFCRLASSRQ